MNTPNHATPKNSFKVEGIIIAWASKHIAHPIGIKDAVDAIIEWIQLSSTGGIEILDSFADKKIVDEVIAILNQSGLKAHRRRIKEVGYTSTWLIASR